MSGPTISGVSGYTAQPDNEYRTVVLGATIAQGVPVIWNTTTSYDGYTVIACAAATLVVGVTCEGGVSGDVVRIQVKGDIATGCGYVTTDGGVTAGQYLHPGTAVADSDAAATALALGTAFGYANAADNATPTITSGFLFCFG